MEGRDKLYEYLMAKARGESELEREEAQGARRDAQFGALTASLAQAASMAGTVGGKRADASPVADYMKMSGMGEAPPSGRAALYEQLAAKRAGQMADADNTQAKLGVEKTRWATDQAERSRHNKEMETIGKTRAAEQPKEHWELVGEDPDHPGSQLERNSTSGEVRPSKLPLGFKPTKGGGQKDPSKDQFSAAGFARRIEQAEQVFGALGKEGYDRAGAWQGAQAILPEGLKGEGLKRQEQAERNFVNSVLRRESGAAISPKEFSEASLQYFPRVGDTQDVIAQKSANRKQKLEELRAESGGAYEKVPLVNVQLPPKRDAGAAIAAPAAPTSPPPGKVRVINPQGKPGVIPESQLEQALKEGYTKAP